MTETRFLVVIEDDAAMGERNRDTLDIDRDHAATLGRETVRILEDGWYRDPDGGVVQLQEAVARMRSGTRSLPPDEELPSLRVPDAATSTVGVVNATTTAASERLVRRGLRPLALNFANGIQSGGGFLSGARAQEESLCRASALWFSLRGDPMYLHHRSLSTPTSSDWCILSPRVPFFRSDAGDLLPEPWFLDVLTCAAPVAYLLAPGEARALLRRRIGRVLAIARAYAYRALVLGAWGCGAFGNDPATTATDFVEAIAGEFRGAFDEVVFAITDWSPDRVFLRPFRDAVSGLKDRV